MKKIFAVLVIFLLGVFLGWGGAKSYGTGTMSQTGQQIGIGGGPADDVVTPRPDAVSTRLTMNNLFREHGVLATLHMQAIVDGKDTKPTAQLLETNAQQIASMVGSVYGDNERTDFLTMWREHINQYELYAKALKNGDLQDAKAVNERLIALSEEMGRMIHNMSPNISESTVTKLMREHVVGTLAIIDAYAADDQEAFVTKIKSNSDQATRFSEYLFKGMQEARPQAFQ